MDIDVRSRVIPDTADRNRCPFISSAVRKGPSQAASIGPSERPLAALDPGDRLMSSTAGLAARLATQVARVRTDIAKLDARPAVGFARG